MSMLKTMLSAVFPKSPARHPAFCVTEICSREWNTQPPPVSWLIKSANERTAASKWPFLSMTKFLGAGTHLYFMMFPCFLYSPRLHGMVKLFYSLIRNYFLEYLPMPYLYKVLSLLKLHDKVETNCSPLLGFLRPRLIVDGLSHQWNCLFHDHRPGGLCYVGLWNFSFYLWQAGRLSYVTLVCIKLPVWLS